jgi:hypothetical protein
VLQQRAVAARFIHCADQRGSRRRLQHGQRRRRRLGRNGSQRILLVANSCVHAIANANANETLETVRRPDHPACFTMDRSRSPSLVLDEAPPRLFARYARVLPRLSLEPGAVSSTPSR